MSELNRRGFLTSSLGAAASWSLATAANATDTKPAAKPESAGNVTPTPSPPGEPASLFLTWWTDPTTTMVIQWIGAQESTQVHYSLYKSETVLTANVKTKPFPDTTLKVHRCELTGLKPGAEYQFRIGESQRSYRFRTMPAKATNTIQFVSGGDCGTGSAAVQTNVLAAKQDPHFALIGGDLAYDNGKSPKTFLTFLENYSQSMRDSLGRMIPMITCIGNHEVTSSGILGTNILVTKKPTAPHYLSVFDGIFHGGLTYNVLDIGDYLSLVLLDTSHIWPIKGAQTDWLANVLAERQSKQHLIVANHVPAYPSYRAYENTGKDNRKYWCPLFEKYNVDAVLEHHDHTFKRTHPLKDGLYDKHGVLYIGDGSWGKLRSIKRPEERPYLAAFGESYHVSVHRLEGDQRSHVALASSGKVADVCLTQGKRLSRRG